VPLLRLAFGTLYDEYIGESEKNLREALATADVLSPCVLWSDRIESTQPLSVIMHEQLNALRAWAVGRELQAHGSEDADQTRPRRSGRKGESQVPRPGANESNRAAPQARAQSAQRPA
jgi:hypothetical protein